MRKLISARFAGKCKKCGGLISAGERAYWLGKGSGMQHLTCADSEPDKPTANAPDDYSFTTRFSDLRQEFRKVISGDFSSFTLNRRVTERIVKYWREDSDWIGCSIPEMSEWLDSGFIVEGLQGIDTSLIPAKPRKRFSFQEEGDELLLDLAWSGSEKFFLDVEKRNTKPGLKLDIHVCFSAYYPAHLIAAYQRWIARALLTLDEAAIDVEIDLIMKERGVFTSNRDRQGETRVKVKEAGEASDFASWSAMFSPGGFRQLGFLGILLSGEHFREEVSEGLGTPRYHNAWTIAYDETENVLTIAHPNSRDEFPEFEMTEKLRAVIDKVSG